LRRPVCLLPSKSVLQPEPVSPELVLVDPDLARRERARLEEKAYLEAVLQVAAPVETAEPPFDLVALRRAVETSLPAVDDMFEENEEERWRHVVTHARKRILPGVLMCSLLVNGFLVAQLVAKKGRETATPVAVRMVTSTEELPIAPSTKAVAPSAPVQPSGSVKTKTFVERKLVSLIVAAPARKLPRRFVDTATGLVKNNVQVICHHRPSRSFLCAVQLAGDGPARGIYVRYRVRSDGRGVFRWYGERAG
jgi:hypothetical protein